MRDRPNILWLTYEDTSPQFVSCYGQTPVVTTPTIDRLAAGGVRFDNAFATAPVCSASRSAIITGCCNQATGLGHHRSKYPIPRELIKGFPYYLQQSGYYTTNNVKTDYNILDERDFVDETWHESSNRAHWRNRSGGQPFFSVFNYMDSHQSRTMTRPWRWYEEQVLGELPGEDVVSPDRVSMPPIYRDTPEMRRHLSRVYNSLRLCDRRIAERLAQLQADGLMDETIIFCFADHGEGIPRGKGNGIGFGYRAAFVIWFPDRYAHLSPWGTQTVTDELVSFEDLAPTVLSLAGLSIPGFMTGRPVLGSAREPAPEFIFAGRDRLDDTPDLCRSATDGRFVYTRNFFPHLPVVKYQKYGDVGEIQQAIRRDYAAGVLDEFQAELVQPTRPREYLFDLRHDPWEIRNLAYCDPYSQELARFRGAVRKHALDVCDVMFLPESEMIERAVDGTPYELRKHPGYNPLADMLAVAELVGQGESAIPEQLAALHHSDSAVRYWAAVGLYAARELIGDHVGELEQHLDDEADYVCVELAAALYGAASHSIAFRKLQEAMLSENPLIVHQVLEKILYMPDAAPDFVEAVTRVHEKLGRSSPTSWKSFPPEQAVDMFMYLYAGKSLYYEQDLPYLGH